jgi:hypothetical protein
MVSPRSGFLVSHVVTAFLMHSHLSIGIFVLSCTRRIDTTLCSPALEARFRLRCFCWRHQIYYNSVTEIASVVARGYASPPGRPAGARHPHESYGAHSLHNRLRTCQLTLSYSFIAHFGCSTPLSSCHCRLRGLLSCRLG